jgi:hypothetical protein
MNRHKITLSIYFLASIADDPDGGKSIPVVLVVAPIVSAVTIPLVVLLIWWIQRRRILGKFLIYIYLFR